MPLEELDELGYISLGFGRSPDNTQQDHDVSLEVEVITEEVTDE